MDLGQTDDKKELVPMVFCSYPISQIERERILRKLDEIDQKRQLKVIANPNLA